MELNPAIDLLNTTAYDTPLVLRQLAMEMSVNAEGNVIVLYGQSLNVGGFSSDYAGAAFSTSDISLSLARDAADPGFVRRIRT